jgi:glycerate 2-kinase
VRIVFAPDSFKGSLTSVAVARALADGWARARPADERVLAPLADGGEGTLVAVAAAGGWTWHETAATDPIGRPVSARWLQSADRRHAFVELAEASGLSRLQRDERDPVGASTFGTGQVLRAVVDAGVREITLGIGGSATSDGGAGILRALGAVIGDAAGDEPGPGATPPPAVAVALAGLDSRIAEVALRIACDVSNPLLGPAGAAATYGPQKGASQAEVETLDRRLAAFADVLVRATGRDERKTPGAGAAGGTAFGLLSLAGRFRSVRLVPGVEVVMDEIDLAGKLASADLVVTGEGRIDGQTAFGKTALGVAQRARASGVPCIAVGGGVEPSGIEALQGLATVVPVVERPMTIEEAMASGVAPVERCGERIAELVSLGAAPGRGPT